MGDWRIIAICHSGGDFFTNNDGLMIYTGGDAHAVDLDQNLLFEDFKSELSMISNVDISTMVIKYFLPNNKRRLITITSDKELKFMLFLNANAVTVDVYILDGTDTRKNGTDSENAKADNAIDNQNSESEKWATDSINGSSGNGSVLADPGESCMLSHNDFIQAVGEEFSSLEDLIEKLLQFAVSTGFTYTFVSKDYTHLSVICTEENCTWCFDVSHPPHGNKYIIERVNNVHTCNGNISRNNPCSITNRMLISMIDENSIAECEANSIVEDIYEDCDSIMVCEVNGIVEDVYEYCGINANDNILHTESDAQPDPNGDCIETSIEVRWFCERIVESNPGSVVTLATSIDSRKYRVFLSFHATLYGFEHGCRPLLILNRIHLQKHKVKLLIAAGVDGNDGIFPVAFSVVEEESFSTWLWFLAQLRYALTASHAITIVSDRQNGLDVGVSQVFENCYHSYCLSSLVKEFRKELIKGPWQKGVKDKMVNDLKSAAKTYTVLDFNACIERIRKISEEMADWVISTKPEHWSNALFKGARYNHLYADNVGFSNWIPVKQQSSVLSMFDVVSSKTMELIHRRRISCRTWMSTLTPCMEQKLKKEISMADKFEAVRSSDAIFEVHGRTVDVVNVGQWECTCRRWQISGLPCMHAVSVLNHLKQPIYNYCSRYLRRDVYQVTYSRSLHRILDEDEVSSLFGKQQ